MKNILYLHAGAEMYGADKVLLELLKGLDKSQYNPIVVLPNDGVLVNALREEGITTEVIPYPILRRKFFNPKGILDYSSSYIKYSKEIIKLVANTKIDLIHVNTTAVLEGIYLKKQLKAPIVWHIHEILLKPKFMYHLLNFLIGKCSDTIVVVSEAVKAHVCQSKFVNPEKVKVIYNGINNQEFHPKNETEYLRNELHIPHDSVIVGMIGRVNAWKGQGDFLSAVEPILAKYDDVYALMVGGVFEGEEWRMEELKSKVAQSSNKERIIIQDFRKDTPNIHNLFDIFILPSTNPDPLPTVVLESMASGKPVISYNHGGAMEMVREDVNGLFSKAGVPSGITSNIELLLDDSKLREKMGRNSAERQATLFSLVSYVKNFQDLYDCF
ncbi:glycosyltransferase family 4 protein [Jeotgalibaca ciconiae]|uniref:Glycosyltransferase family 1 protein n=1 Tax=Jeotgalibaca ciconiae TaxID=2496265 RepID=A0A3Q9BL57_9LACT|nr:glycosyltransferase family 4 protein [Jeotgalibaca ciconiae]AZP04920.1 glycosyltransferase family 1 protein [Jeotgalibaca ciconiae]